MEIQNSATLKRVSWEANTDTIALLQIGTAANQVAIPYSNFNVAPAYNGSIFQIFNPGQYIFKTFFIKNTLDIFLLLTNYNANSANYRSTIIIETDEKIIYQ